MLHSLRSEKGVALLWTAVVALILFAIGAFAVDLGNLWLVRNELQNTADSAALAAASALGSGDFKQVYARARAWAAENTADGEAVNLNYEDIEVGRWDPETRTFTGYDPFGAMPVDSDGNTIIPNAVKVKASRDEEHNKPVKLMFGRLLGQDEAELSAEAIAMGTPAPNVAAAPLRGVPPVRTPNPANPVLLPALPGRDDIDTIENEDEVCVYQPNHGGYRCLPRSVMDAFPEELQDRIKWGIAMDPYVMYVMDASDSMVNYADESKELAQTLLHWSETAVVGKLITKVGLASFEDEAEIKQDLSNNVGAVYEGIEELHFGEVPEDSHSVVKALDISLERLWEEPTGELQIDKIAYLFSDGRFTEEEIAQALAEAEKAKAGRENEKGELEPITIHTFGIGDDVNEEALKKIAEASGGAYHRCEEIMAKFQESMDNYMVWLVK